MSAWASIMGNTPQWTEAVWAPLEAIRQKVGLVVKGCADVTPQLLREAEVVLWFSFTLAASWPEHEDMTPAALAVFQLGALDSAPEPWRTLIWSAGCNLVSTAPAEHCERAIDWMLQRSPQGGSAELLQHTELPYARALEMTCRHMPSTTVQVVVAERLMTMALAPSSNFHEQSPRLGFFSSVRCRAP